MSNLTVETTLSSFSISLANWYIVEGKLNMSLDNLNKQPALCSPNNKFSGVKMKTGNIRRHNAACWTTASLAHNKNILQATNNMLTVYLRLNATKKMFTKFGLHLRVMCLVVR